MIAIAVASGCGGDGEDTSTPPTDTAAAPGVEHVHGLGIDPEDGSLYIATHFGTFRLVDGGDPERMGDSFQDTMGFTVAGPGRFLGSGHPDVAGMRAGQPGLLGLIESTDGGASWTSLSLAGEADFHGLAFAHGRVYGWNSSSGQFMVSDDLEAWQARATIDLYSFAVDPEMAAHIIGTSPDGLVQSIDDGATWTPLAGPQAVIVAWDAASGLWGADGQGAVAHSADAGATWKRAGDLPGQPQAFLATEDALWAAALDGERTGIYRSDDDGATWELRYRDPDE